MIVSMLMKILYRIAPVPPLLNTIITNAEWSATALSFAPSCRIQIDDALHKEVQIDRDSRGVHIVLFREISNCAIWEHVSVTNSPFQNYVENFPRRLERQLPMRRNFSAIFSDVKKSSKVQFLVKILTSTFTFVFHMKTLLDD